MRGMRLDLTARKATATVASVHGKKKKATRATEAKRSAATHVRTAVKRATVKKAGKESKESKES